MLANCVICNDVIFIHTMSQQPIFQGPFCCGPECLEEAAEEAAEKERLRPGRRAEIKKILEAADKKGRP